MVPIGAVGPLSRFCPDMLLTPRPAAFLCHERRTFLGVTVPSPPVVGISRPIALPPLLRDVPTATSPHCRTINAGPPSTPTHTLHTALSSSDHQSHPLAPSLTVVADRDALASHCAHARSLARNGRGLSCGWSVGSGTGSCGYPPEWSCAVRLGTWGRGSA